MIAPVLCYHKIERRRELGVTRLSPRHFAAQVQALAVRIEIPARFVADLVLALKQGQVGHDGFASNSRATVT